MTRCIAILTLALTAALSADQAFALDPGNCSSALRTGVMIEDQGGGSDIYRQDELEFNLHGGGDEFYGDLVAFVAYEYGTEAAYEMLLEIEVSRNLNQSIWTDIRLNQTEAGTAHSFK